MKKMTPSFFSAKILLFGEYGIVVGGSGLAIPFKKYGGQLDRGELSETQQVKVQSNQSIKQLFNYLKTNSPDYPFINFDLFESDLENGLWFDSNIPNGYGLGSSGALVAALYSRYATDKVDDLQKVKRRLAAIESFFHSSSSGIDPTVAFHNQPLIMQGSSGAQLLPDWTLRHSGLNVYLVDTRVVSKTLSLVEWFKTQMLKPQFSHDAKKDYIDVNQRIVDKVAGTGKIELTDVLGVTRYQIDYFTPMIPEFFRKHFFDSLSGREFAFKLCGSGGGGYMLCFSASTKVEDYFKQNKLIFERIN